MTEENFKKAKQIKIDIDAIENMTISVCASKELMDSWQKWANDTKAKLKKEFTEL